MDNRIENLPMATQRMIQTTAAIAALRLTLINTPNLDREFRGHFDQQLSELIELAFQQLSGPGQSMDL